MHRGWITAKKEDRAELEALGIKLGEYDEEQMTFEGCEVSDEAMEKLDPLWGRFFWGLREVKP